MLLLLLLLLLFVLGGKEAPHLPRQGTETFSQIAQSQRSCRRIEPLSWRVCVLYAVPQSSCMTQLRCTLADSKHSIYSMIDDAQQSNSLFLDEVSEMMDSLSCVCAVLCVLLCVLVRGSPEIVNSCCRVAQDTDTYTHALHRGSSEP